MPEGPEIRLAADKIAKVLVDRSVVDAKLTLPSLRRAKSRLVGATVTAVDTHGKAMLTRFDNGLTLYSHNQLYGRWYVTRRDKTPNTRRNLRVALHTEQHSAWLYSATDIELLNEAGVKRHPFLVKLGPDILDMSLKPRDISARLEDKRFAGRQLAALYLDQGFIAGIGNYLRSEILFVAGVDPFRRPKDLEHDERMSIARATLDIGRRAYKQRGVTVPRELASGLKKAGQRYGEYRHWVFTRDGNACRRCGTRVEKHAVSGRSVFICPACQR